MTTTTHPRRIPPGLAIAVLCFGGLVSALTQTLVIPIQPELPELLGTDASNSAWVITVTLLTAAVATVVSGRLGDMFGKQRVLLASLSLLAVASVVCALSDTIVPMLVGRALQGLAMGFIPVAIAMIREIVPPNLRSQGVAAVSATMGVGGAVGLPLAAWIVEVGSWHALFWMSGIAALIALVAVIVTIPNVEDAHGGRIDVGGIILLTVGLISFLLGISKATTWGWSDPATLGTIIGGVVVLIGFGGYELRHDDPLVDLRTSASRPVLLTNLAGIAIGFGMMAQSIVVPQLLQTPEATGYGLGQSILAAGLWMAPGGLMMMLFAPVSSKLIDTIGAKVTLMIGASILACGYLLATALMGAPWQLMVASCVASAGVGVGYAAMPTLIMDNSPESEAGAAVGLNSLSRAIGTTLAAAVMGTILSTKTEVLAPGVEIPSQSGYVLCFVVGAGAAIVGVLIVAMLPSRRRKGGDHVAHPGGRATDEELVLQQD